MKKELQKLFGKYFNKTNSNVIPHGRKGVEKIGHKEYVGGMWEEIGELQFQFLVKEGLKPDSFLLDIGCGSLRGGIYFINYLKKGHYMGIDKESILIELGIEKELGRSKFNELSPEFVVSDQFEFHKFSSKPDYAIAQSLFTHLPEEIILDCMQNLKQNFASKGKFYATFFESKQKTSNPKSPHDHKGFHYCIDEIKSFGTNTGWNCEYIGDWGHPRNQIIVKYTPK